MAIQKSKTLPSGVTGNYWRLKNAVIDIDRMEVNMVLGLYLDQTHGTNGSASIMSKHVKLGITQQQLATGSLANAYQRILDQANEDIPGFFGQGTRKFDPDLAGGTIV